MNLIDIYIHEVTRRLPEKNREDIALELRSTIEDMLPDDYSEKDVKVVLEKLGNPAVLASRYRDQLMHLIGPHYYDVYITLLKMILPIAMMITLISNIVDYFIQYSGDEALINVFFHIFGEGVWGIIEAGIQVFFWLTLTFAIIERTDKGKEGQPFTKRKMKWNPDDLKNISYIPKRKAITKWEVFGSLFWTAIWGTVYFYANQLVGVYRGGEGRLDFIKPAFNQDVLLHYGPLVFIVIVAEIALALYKLNKGQWTKKTAIFNFAVQLIGTIAFIVVLVQPNLLNQDFIVYMSDLFTISSNQLETWIVGGGSFIFIISAAINVYDGFRKAKIR